MQDLKYMMLALEQAKLAFQRDEVPVGAVIVYQDQVIARAHNTNHQEQNALNHAEINVIDQACRYLGNKDLSECCLYVTLEPCMMCTGAILNSKIKKVCFGAFDLKYGAIISNQFYKDTKHIIWTPGVLKMNQQCF